MGPGGSLAAAVGEYLQLGETVALLRGRLPPERVLDVRHEALLARPHESLNQACSFLGLHAEADHVDACAFARSGVGEYRNPQLPDARTTIRRDHASSGDQVADGSNHRSPG